MKASLAALRRGSLAVFAFGALAFSLHAQAQSTCNATPKAKIDPSSQTVAESIPGNPTVVTLNGSTSTAGNGSPQFLWQQLAGTPVTLSSATAAAPTFVAPSIGATMLRFRLTVTCGNKSDSTTGDVNVTDVVTNAPPTALASATPDNAREGERVSLDGTASYDIDPGTTLTYQWSQTSGSPTVVLDAASADGSIVTFFAPNTPIDTGATLTFRLVVSDGTLTGTTDKSVNIVWTNDPPVAALACPATGIFEVDEGDTVTLDGSGSRDPDGQIVSYSWSQAVGLPNLDIGGLATPSISFAAPKLGYQQLGSVTLTLTVTDNIGATSAATCSLFIADVSAPEITVPSDVTVEADFPGGKAFSYRVTAFDSVDDHEPYPLACAPTSGSDFALAAAPVKQLTTPVQCSATDSASNTATATFNVTVQDTTAPVMTLPLSLAIEATGPEGAIADFPARTSDAVDGDGVAACVPASGSVFGLATTVVTCNASDARGNAAEAGTFELTVHDTTPPAISAHGDEVAEATSADGTIVGYELPAVSDLVSADLVASCVPASGSSFPLGATTITCNANDGAGNAAPASTFRITVQDTTAPVIAAHDDETIEATGPGGAVVGYALPTVMDVVSTALVADCLPASGTAFALGSTLVTCSATDAAGNRAVETSFNVTVQDTTAPQIADHGNETREATGPGGALVTYALPAVFDAVSTNLAATCLPASGSLFGLGAHVVSCEVEDDAGNAAATTTFQVNVQDTTPPAIEFHATVNATAASNSAARVEYSLPGAADLVDGTVAVACIPVSGSTFTVGTTAVTCSAQDSRGNASTSTFDVTVGYAWTGFFRPVDNAPTFNAAKAGSAVPVKFSLGGNQGMAILAAGYPKSGPIQCDASDGDPLEETVLAGGSSLQYDATADQYTYVWKTEKNWAGCRILQIRLRDGSTKSALFRFR